MSALASGSVVGTKRQVQMASMSLSLGDGGARGQPEGNLHQIPQDWNLPPSQWKEAALVLLPKEGKPSGQPSLYWPICLLDGTGKLFKQIIARRPVLHLSKGENLDQRLSPD
jgi:hypothetical protein